jgi:hypothetical protein
MRPACVRDLRSSRDVGDGAKRCVPPFDGARDRATVRGESCFPVCEWLGNAVTHAGIQAALLVAGHGFDGHRNNGDVPAMFAFLLMPAGRRWVAIQQWHLAVHEYGCVACRIHKTEGLPSRSLRFRYPFSCALGEL